MANEYVKKKHSFEHLQEFEIIKKLHRAENVFRLC